MPLSPKMNGCCCGSPYCGTCSQSAEACADPPVGDMFEVAEATDYFRVVRKFAYTDNCGVQKIQCQTLVLNQQQFLNAVNAGQEFTVGLVRKQNAEQTGVGTSVDTAVIFDSVVSDPGGAWNSVDNEWIVPCDGDYVASGVMAASYASGDARLATTISVNGMPHVRANTGQWDASAMIAWTSPFRAVLPGLVAGDTLSVDVFLGSSASAEWYLGSTADSAVAPAFFQLNKIGSLEC